MVSFGLDRFGVVRFGLVCWLLVLPVRVVSVFLFSFLPYFNCYSDFSLCVVFSFDHIF